MRTSNSEQEHQTRRGRARLGDTINLNLYSLCSRNPLRSFRLEDRFVATVIIQVEGDYVRLWRQRREEVDVYMTDVEVELV